jgi:hypothetical protein
MYSGKYLLTFCFFYSFFYSDGRGRLLPQKSKNILQRAVRQVSVGSNLQTNYAMVNAMETFTTIRNITSYKSIIIIIVTCTLLLGNKLVNSPLIGYATIEEAVFSMSSEPSNSRTTVLRNPFLSNGTVNTSTQ